MTDSNGRPEGSHDLAPGSSFEVPVVEVAVPAPLGRRALRELRERELSQAADIRSDSPVGAATPTRRARRDIRGLEHLLLAPAAPVPSAARAPDEVPAATAAPAPAAALEPAAAVAPVAADEPIAADEPAQAALHFDTEDLPEAHATSVHTMTFSRDDETRAPARVSAPRGARSSVSSGEDPRRRIVPRLRRTGGSSRPDARKRTIASTVVMVATAGLVATIALPAYAYDTNNLMSPNLQASSQLGIQSLTVAGVDGQSSARDDYSTTGNIAAMDSTMGTTVSPTVQALAAELMADVASGKLVGSVPDHIVEIRNLANGVAVPGCGVDYRVLQTIKVAVDNFDKVGVSDINRHCTGQIEGAGTASSHYKDGGGHAVDFYILNGHGLTGADSDSLKLIGLLDPLVPKGSGLGQSECRPSISVSNFAPFPDTCTHMHVDFGAAQGVALKS
ncbi:hypothetical protein B7R54_07685 [Subtercola boreus]|uniref:Uncharacterized protein n=1 Tax=Subtercola boreus TaxID=120213 RepID=A0A3E0VHH4_9MICO|nr:hypothetical protein [Subtercola boreus]RFA09119.1 hypothetical protein B7R54_07685 [Subtercola boreus]TQL53871.1 hypothetical protein FB464_1390 [Subtercola boreus]